MKFFNNFYLVCLWKFIFNLYFLYILKNKYYIDFFSKDYYNIYNYIKL